MRETSWPFEKLLDFSRSTVFNGVIWLVDVHYIVNARTKVIVKNRAQIGFREDSYVSLPGLWHRVIWFVGLSVSKETATFFCLEEIKKSV
jgi:hypothetical protein